MGWQRTAVDRLENGPARIDKSHIARSVGEPAPIYHAHVGYAFVGAFPCPDSAKAACEAHPHFRSLPC
ncbi:hypothetical protein [Thauera butanivorans]|uniref:hypothetical protein n=1 Tax=Thauera butanivorans TaxID=86174 RepID=UPI0008389BA7|nr:hypothetical protein [Thauera butanivorans]